MVDRNEMSLNDLIKCYLNGSKIASCTTTTAAAGSEVLPLIQSEEFTDSPRAKAWGDLVGGEAIFLRLPSGDFVLSSATFQELQNLMERDLSTCKVLDGHLSSAAVQPGARVLVNLKTPLPDGRDSIEATLLYEGAEGDVKVFEVEGKHYVISPAARRLAPLDDRRTL